MAKRARGSVRPGQRRPIDAPARALPPTPAAAAAPVAAAPPASRDAELARAAEIEAQIARRGARGRGRPQPHPRSLARRRPT